jgi:hypothetical protein
MKKGAVSTQLSLVILSRELGRLQRALIAEHRELRTDHEQLHQKLLLAVNTLRRSTLIPPGESDWIM